MRGALLPSTASNPLEGGALAGNGVDRPRLHDVRGLRVPLEAHALRHQHQVPRKPAVEAPQARRPAVAEQVGDERPVLVAERRTVSSQLQRDAGRAARRQRQLGVVTAQKAHEAGDGGEHLDPQEALQLIERGEVLPARRAGGQRRADGDAGVGMPGPQLVGQERHLRLGPDSDDAEPHGRIDAPAADHARELRLEIRVQKVVQRVAVDGDHLLVRGRRRREGEGGAVGATQAVGPEVGQVLALGGIVGIVPVTDVHHPQPVVGLGERPAEEAGDRPLGGIVAHEPARLVVADVQQVGQRRVRRQRLDEVVLQALGDEHAEPGGAVTHSPGVFHVERSIARGGHSASRPGVRIASSAS